MNLGITGWSGPSSCAASLRKIRTSATSNLCAEGWTTAAQAAGLADPFCYVSHLSALQQHGLTKETTSPLHLTVLRRPAWLQARDTKIAMELGGPNPSAASLLVRPSFKTKLRRRSLKIHETSARQPTVLLDNGKVRVSTVGAFLDSLVNPSECGGMAQVVAIWERHARPHADAIIAEVDRADAKIVKVRAGYLLSERLGMDIPAVMAWRAFAQRGGSRRLDPEAPYAPQASEAWMLSINI